MFKASGVAMGIVAIVVGVLVLALRVAAMDRGHRPHRGRGAGRGKKVAVADVGPGLDATLAFF